MTAPRRKTGHSLLASGYKEYESLRDSSFPVQNSLRDGIHLTFSNDQIYIFYLLFDNHQEYRDLKTKIDRKIV